MDEDNFKNLDEKDDNNAYEILLSTVEKEYDKEIDRVKTLDTRTNIFVTLGGVLLVYLPGNIKSLCNLNQPFTTIIGAIPELLKLLLLLSIFISLILSFIFFSLVISLKEYKRISDEIFDECNFKYSKRYCAETLILMYKKVLEENSKVNELKSKYYKRGFYLMMVALALNVIAYIIVLLN